MTLLDTDGKPTREIDSLWGIESDAGNYLDTIADELAREIIERIGKVESLTVRLRA